MWWEDTAPAAPNMGFLCLGSSHGLTCDRSDIICRLAFALAGAHLVLLRISSIWLAPVPGQGSTSLDPASASQVYGMCSLSGQVQELRPASNFSPAVAMLMSPNLPLGRGLQAGVQAVSDSYVDGSALFILNCLSMLIALSSLMSSSNPSWHLPVLFQVFTIPADL